jgi:hypothetical protein
MKFGHQISMAFHHNLQKFLRLVVPVGSLLQRDDPVFLCCLTASLPRRSQKLWAVVHRWLRF